jgi:hypothetical protein
MSTVDKKIADRIISGEFPEDRCQLIVEYDNAFGGVSYGCTFEGEDLQRYLRPTHLIRNPRIYWRQGEDE